MPEHIRVESSPAGVATITLSRPEKKNALSIALRDEVSDALTALAEDPAVKLIVVTGAGDVFSAGFDLKEFRDLGDPAHAERLWASSESGSAWHRHRRPCPNGGRDGWA